MISYLAMVLPHPTSIWCHCLRRVGRFTAPQCLVTPPNPQLFESVVTIATDMFMSRAPFYDSATPDTALPLPNVVYQRCRSSPLYAGVIGM